MEEMGLKTAKSTAGGCVDWRSTYNKDKGKGSGSPYREHRRDAYLPSLWLAERRIQ